jgi:TRAP-type C4-dicarboxylate transport system substrate-binding protein
MVQPNQFLLSEFTRKKISPKLLDLLYKTAAEVSEEYTQISYDIEDNLLTDLGKNMQIIEVDQALFKKAMDPLYAKYVSIWGQDILDAIAAAK